MSIACSATLPRIGEFVHWEVIVNLVANTQTSKGDPCPGNNEGVAKRRSEKTRTGSVCASFVSKGLAVASCTKDTYLAPNTPSDCAPRARSGRWFAVAHATLIIAYHLVIAYRVVQQQCTYQELQANYFGRATG